MNLTKTHCKHGHSRVPENLDKRGACKICRDLRYNLWALEHPDDIKTHKQKYADSHVEEKSLYGKRRRRQHPDAERSTKLRYRYGITLEEYNALLKAQSGLCAICTEELSGRKHLDHDHVSGRVRGILCQHCNRGLGGFRDKPEHLKQAALYIERHLCYFRDWRVP